MKKWLLYVRYNLSGLVVYSVETDDILHCIGALYYTSFEKIERVTAVPFTDRREQFWHEQNKNIIEYNDLHYKKKED